MNNLKSKIESLLFISAKPLTLKRLSELLGANIKEIEKVSDELINEYKEKSSGIQIIKSDAKYQMVSAPNNSELIQKFIKDETTSELSRPSLETLTIIAYRGPISKIDLDRIRGINCSLILRNLLLHGLIEAENDKKKDETYYTITLDFMRFLGINNIEELPDYQKLHQDDTLNRMLE